MLLARFVLLFDDLEQVFEVFDPQGDQFVLLACKIKSLVKPWLVYGLEALMYFPDVGY